MKGYVRKRSRACDFGDSAEVFGVGSDGDAEGKTAIKMFQRYPEMKKKPYWGTIFGREGIV